MTLTEKQWLHARNRLDARLQRYLLYGVTGGKLTMVIAAIFLPLARRYRQGERTIELYEAIRDVVRTVK